MISYHVSYIPSKGGYRLGVNIEVKESDSVQEMIEVLKKFKESFSYFSIDYISRLNL